MSMVVFTINRGNVLEGVREEVSRVAASAYDGEGQSLYDAIMVYERDESTLQRLFDDALSHLTDRSRDILNQYTKTSDTVRVLEYYLPDFSDGLMDMVTADIQRYMTQHITAQWLIEKQYKRAEDFVAHANAVLDETIEHLKIRKPISDRIGL